MNDFMGGLVAGLMFVCIILIAHQNGHDHDDDQGATA